MAGHRDRLTAAALLGLLGDPRRPDIDARHVAIVVAHPDDETFGCGAALARLRGATLVHVTDGAPRNGVDARTYGFSGWEDYAEARREELDEAMLAGKAQSAARFCLGVPDQEADLRLTEIVDSLSRLFEERKISIVMTHVFEGGHPDHDSVAFSVAHAARSVEIVEMPYYRLGPSGELSQVFLDVDGAGDEHRLDLTDEERERKGRMIAAFKTQAEPLARVSGEFETFRTAPRYDFSSLPNGGNILYEQLFDWGISGERVRDHFIAAREALKIHT